MNLEQIKQDKIKEAEELFFKIGLDPEKDLTMAPYTNEFLINYPIKTEEQDKKSKLIWTRLSINSNIGCIVE